MLEPPRLSPLADRSDRHRRVSGDRRASATSPAQCDWVIADENSNVHLPVLKLGIPTVAIRIWASIREPLRSLRLRRARHRVSAGASIRDVGRTRCAAFFCGLLAARGSSDTTPPTCARTAIVQRGAPRDLAAARRPGSRRGGGTAMKRRAGTATGAASAPASAWPVSGALLVVLYRSLDVAAGRRRRCSAPIASGSSSRSG